ncbi:hypothetical protein ACKWTF_015206 [Chironomus riparius]
MELPCTYRHCSFIDKSVYTCEFFKQDIPKNGQIMPKGLHQFNQQGNKLNNKNVFAVIFIECNITKVPRGLKKLFPRMKILSILSSTLKVVTKADLIEYKNIERIGFCDNQIEYLPGNLFEGFTNLEEVSFNGNKLKLIEPNILDGLQYLKTVNFNDNPGYKKCFSSIKGFESNATLDEVKDELFLKFYRDFMKINDFLKIEDENQDLKKKNQSLNVENLILKENSLSYQSRYLKCLNEIQRLKDQLKKRGQDYSQINQSDIKTFLETDETFRDFSIQIDNREFPVHKFLLAARSPTLAEILKNNPEVENLKLVDISMETFEIILKFLYTDELPGDDGANFLHLFAAAGKLKIQELKNYAATKLIDQINEDNVIDILNVSKNYEHEELRTKAFEEVKKKYPKIEFKDEWAANPEKLIKIIEIIKKKEEAVRKIEEAFKELGKK